jgi:beta-lactamase regulating signal transducer with metallopeptidase domain
VSSTIADAALAIAAFVFDSLWEGALIVGAVWLALRWLPALGAATRYAIWLFALASLVVVPILTVGLSVQPAQSASDAAPSTQHIGASVTAAVQPPVAAAQAAREPAMPVGELAATAPRKARIAVPHDLVVAVALTWILIACLRGILLLLDVRALAAVRRNARLWSNAEGYPVLLSERVHVPLASGFLRAAVVLPATLVERLPADAVDTIVEHELAHLRRYDVWTNGFARIAQVFVALNPVAWFVMRRLALEREIACDDWVVARTGRGDAFARALAALATSAGAHMPLAAPSALGSRHSIVVRIERLLDSGPRRLRLSPPALGGAFMLLALIAFALQSLSPVLAYEPAPDLLAQVPATSGAASCAVPNRGIVMSYVLGPRYRAASSPADDTQIPSASSVVARVGASHAATFDLTVDAAGKPRKVVVISPRYPAMVRTVTHIVMRSTFKPALRDCVPVTATIRTAFPIDTPEETTASVITPAYPVGWRGRHETACKVPVTTHTRFRSGYVAPNAYTDMLPAFPKTMKDIAIGAKFRTSVRVHVDAAGAATSAALAHSSGQQAFDDAALAAARRATYPLTRTSCTPLPSDYVWNTTFERNSLLFRLGQIAGMPPARR